MSRATKIPAYSLFGQQAGLVEPRFYHVERIGQRWRLHGGAVEEHSHPHLHQLTAWVSGQGEYRADDAVAAIHPLTVCWMPAGVVHGFTVDTGSDAIVLSMSDDFAREQLLPLARETQFNPFHEALVIQPAPDRAEWLGDLFTRMEQEYARGLAGHAQAVGSLATLVMAELRRMSSDAHAAAPGGRDEPSLLVRFMGLLESTLGERTTIGQMARRLGTTPYLLNRACRQGLNLNASDVVRNRHMQEAKRLLLFTSLGIAEIGQAVGYADPAHFARTFRAATSQSPGDWRETRAPRRSTRNAGQK